MPYFNKWLSVALAAFDPGEADLGIGRYVDTLGFTPDALTFQVEFADFVHLHNGLSSDTLDRKFYNLKGLENEGSWTSEKFHELVRQLKQLPVKSYLMLVSWTNLPDYGAVCHWYDDHQELIQTNIRGRRSYGDCINHFKRFANGEYYEDFFARKLVSVLNDYEFDGLVLADGYIGLRGPFETLEHTDYSEDMLRQFADYLKSGSQQLIADFVFNPEVSLADKAKYIWSNFRREWTAFYALRHEQFFVKSLAAVQPYGKEIVILDAWAKCNADAYYDYGVDYQRLAECGLKTIIVQAHECVKELRFHEGWSVSEHAQNMHILSLRAQLPDVKILVSTCTIGNSETWAATRATPACVERELASYLNLVYWDAAGNPRKCVDGTWVIEGFGLKKSEWEWLADIWNSNYGSKPESPGGLALLWSNDIFNYYQKIGKRYSFSKHLYNLVHAGLPVHAGALLGSLPAPGLESGSFIIFEPNGLSGPVYDQLAGIIANPQTMIVVVGDIYDDQVFEKLFGLNKAGLFNEQPASQSWDNFCQIVYGDQILNCDRYEERAAWMAGQPDLAVTNIDWEARDDILALRADLADGSVFQMIISEQSRWIYLNRSDVPELLKKMIVKRVLRTLADQIEADAPFYTIEQAGEVAIFLENADNLFYKEIKVKSRRLVTDAIRQNRLVQRTSVKDHEFSVIVPPQGVAKIVLAK